MLLTVRIIFTEQNVSVLNHENIKIIANQCWELEGANVEGIKSIKFFHISWEEVNRYYLKLNSVV